MNFPEIGPAHAPETEISEKIWMSFPGNYSRVTHRSKKSMNNKCLESY